MKLLMQKAHDGPPRPSEVQGYPTQHREGRLINLLLSLPQSSRVGFTTFSNLFKLAG